MGVFLNSFANHHRQTEYSRSSCRKESNGQMGERVAFYTGPQNHFVWDLDLCLFSRSLLWGCGWVTFWSPSIKLSFHKNENDLKTILSPPKFPNQSLDKVSFPVFQFPSLSSTEAKTYASWDSTDRFHSDFSQGLDKKGRQSQEISLHWILTRLSGSIITLSCVYEAAVGILVVPNTHKEEHLSFNYIFYNLWYCSVTKFCAILCDHVDCSTVGSSVLHYLLEFAQIHVHCVSDAF